MSVDVLEREHAITSPTGRFLAEPWAIAASSAVLWTIVNWIANSATALNHDMIEAYVWGHNLQLGYYKHPPFWAWVAGLWFSVLPPAGWSFAALSACNAAIGLAGAWYLTGCFVRGDKQVASVLLLLASPLYTFYAYKFNANTIFLSLWPWAAYAFVRSLKGEGAGFGATFGILAGLMILSKYLALVPLAACLIAAATHTDARRYFRSASPYLAILACAATIAPHVAWLVATGWRPFHYFASETGQGGGFMLQQTLNLLPQYLGVQILIAAAVVIAADKPLRLRTLLQDPNRRLIAILAAGPFILTIFASLGFRVLLTSNTVTAFFCLTPLLLIEGLPIKRPAKLRRWAERLTAAFTAISILAAPVVAYGHARGWMRGSPTMSQPSEELSAAATAIWRQTAGRPLRIVAGTQLYADSVSFYSTEHPAEFIDFDTAKAPWIDTASIARDGILVVCAVGDDSCIRRASELSNRRTIRRTLTLRHSAFGITGAPARFVVFVNPGDGTGGGPT